MRNVFFKVAIKTLVKSKKRAMATLVGIVISVSLITGTLVTSEIFQRFFREVSSSNYGSWKLATEGVEKEELKNQNLVNPYMQSDFLQDYGPLVQQSIQDEKLRNWPPMLD